MDDQRNTHRSKPCCLASAAAAGGTAAAAGRRHGAAAPPNLHLPVLAGAANYLSPVITQPPCCQHPATSKGARQAAQAGMRGAASPLPPAGRQKAQGRLQHTQQPSRCSWLPNCLPPPSPSSSAVRRLALSHREHMARGNRAGATLLIMALVAFCAQGEGAGGGGWAGRGKGATRGARLLVELHRPNTHRAPNAAGAMSQVRRSRGKPFATGRRRRPLPPRPRSCRRWLDAASPGRPALIRCHRPAPPLQCKDGEVCDAKGKPCADKACVDCSDSYQTCKQW